MAKRVIRAFHLFCVINGIIEMIIRHPLNLIKDSVTVWILWFSPAKIVMKYRISFKHMVVYEIEFNQADFPSNWSVLTMSTNSRQTRIDESRSLKVSSGRNSMDSDTTVCANGKFRSHDDPKRSKNKNTRIELHTYPPKRKYGGNSFCNIIIFG